MTKTNDAPAQASVEAAWENWKQRWGEGLPPTYVYEAFMAGYRAALSPPSTVGAEDDAPAPAPSGSGVREAANKAEAILRQVRKFIAAENKHARLSEQGKNSTRDDVDFEHAQLVGDFSERDCDEALRIVKRRRASLASDASPNDGLIHAPSIPTCGPIAPMEDIASDASPRGEAVAWRFRYPLHGGKFTHWEFETDADRIKWLTRSESEAQGEPLYAHPAPATVEMREAHGPETEAVLRRDGFFLELEWWRFGKKLTGRVYEPQGIKLSHGLADLLALALEDRPTAALAPATEGRKG